jgi:hypothetical protein
MISASIWLISCEEINPNPCGPFDNRYVSTGLTASTLKIISYDSLQVKFTFDYLNEADTVSFNKFAVSLTPKKQFYRVSALPQRHSFSIFSGAYACSPPIPYSEEKVDSIIITSTSDFDQAHKSGNDLADLFDVAVLDQSGSKYYRMGLTDYLALGPTTKDQLVLCLKKAPQKTDDFVFKIQYSKSMASENSTFIVESANVFIPGE